MNKVKYFYLCLPMLIIGSTALAQINCNQYGNPYLIQNCQVQQNAANNAKRNMLSDFNNAMGSQQSTNPPITGSQQSPTYILPNALPPTPNLNPPPQPNRTGPVRHFYY